MKIKWPESVVGECNHLYDPVVTKHARLHRTLMLLREDEKFREHIQPVKAIYDTTTLSKHNVRLTFVCTTLGKTLLEAAYLSCCEDVVFTGKMALSIEIRYSADGVRQPYLVWETSGSTLSFIDAMFDNIAYGLSEILKEGI